MARDYASTAEAADPYCLRAGEAAVLLAGHPWRRFVVIGDSVAEGLGDPVPGYTELPWCDRIARELTVAQPDLCYLNLGERNLRAAAVRAGQLEPALAAEPDLALVAAGGNDALRPAYDPEAVDRELVAMISALRECGAQVITVGMFDLSYCPAVSPRYRPSLGERMRLLSARTRAIGEALGTLHIDFTDHPASSDPSMYSADGLHGNLRSHAICAAETVRRLGAYLGNRFPVTDRS